MKKPSAGILVYRHSNGQIELLLGHPGGPYWAKKDIGAWSIPKGEFEKGEAPMSAAQREFLEETGSKAPEGAYIDLGEVTRDDGKRIIIWAIEGEVDLANFSSNMFELEWPPKSGIVQEFPEIDQIAWICLNSAPAKMHKGQVAFVERLAEYLNITIQPNVNATRQPLLGCEQL